MLQGKLHGRIRSCFSPQEVSTPNKEGAFTEETWVFHSCPLLSRMQASHQPEGVDSIADYTETWSALTDRGGQYSTSAKVFQLFQEIEL